MIDAFISYDKKICVSTSSSNLSPDEARAEAAKLTKLADDLDKKLKAEADEKAAREAAAGLMKAGNLLYGVNSDGKTNYFFVAKSGFYRSSALRFWQLTDPAKDGVGPRHADVDYWTEKGWSFSLARANGFGNTGGSALNSLVD